MRNNELTMTASLRLKMVLMTVAVLAAAGLFFVFDPLKAGFFPRCPFNMLTGLYCPGCGTQRAMHELLHGHLLQAADDNLLSVLALPVVGYSAAAFVGSHLWNLAMRQDFLYRPWFAKGVLGVVVLFWVLRNLPFPWFRWLAP